MFYSPLYRTLLNILIPLLSRVDDMLFCGVKMTFMGTKGYGQKRTPPKRCMGRVLVVRFFTCGPHRSCAG